MDSASYRNEAAATSARPPVGMAILWMAGTLGLAALVVRMATGSAEIGQDQAWLLYAAERMLHGVELYGSQLTETNPPLIIWLSALAVGLGRVTGMAAPQAFYLMVTAAMVGSAAWCYRLLEGAGYSRTRRWLLAAGVLLVESRPVLEALGQREHLLVVLVMPFLLALGVRRRVVLARWEVVATSVVAALAICLKPQQVVLLAGFLGAVGWVRWRENRQRNGATDATDRNGFGGLVLAVVVVCSVCGAYGVAVMVFAPMYVRGEMPLLVNTYWAFGTYSFWQLVVLDRHFLAYAAMGLVLWLYARRRGLPVAMPGCLLVASVAASVAFDLQHTGFMYQHIPQDLLAELTIFWLVVELAGERMAWVDAEFAVPRWAMAVFAVAFCVMAGAAAALQQDRLHVARVATPRTLQEFYASLPEATPVMSLSTNPQAVFPFVEQRKLVLASRFVHLWMLPAVQQNEWYRSGGPRPRKVLPDDVVARAGALQREQVAADLAERKPLYVVVPRCARAFDCEAIGEAGFSIVSWLLRDAGFAREWAGYGMVGVVDAAEQGLVYEIYRRR